MRAFTYFAAASSPAGAGPAVRRANLAASYFYTVASGVGRGRGQGPGPAAPPLPLSDDLPATPPSPPPVLGHGRGKPPAPIPSVSSLTRQEGVKGRVSAMEDAPNTQPVSLYVGDLDESVNEGDLVDAFSGVGDVSVRVCWDQVSRYGYVNFPSAQDATKAMKKLNHASLNGKPIIRVMRSCRYSNGWKSGVRYLFVKNLDEKIDSMKLEDLFSSFGSIISCKVVASSDGKSKGFGFVQYDSEESVKSAIENMNGKKVEDKEIYVAHLIKKNDKDLFTKLYIKNFDFDVTKEQLMVKFSKFGKISKLVIFKDSNGASKGVGYVNYENPEDAEKAFEEMNGSQLATEAIKKLNHTLLNGKPIRVMRSRRDLNGRKSGVRKSGVRYLFVKNLDENIDKLEDLFSSFGTIISCKVVASSDGKSLGFGFVQYDSEESVKSAIENLNGKKVEDKEIYVAHLIKKRDKKLFTKLYIENFDFDVTKEQLMEKFSKFGKISKLVIAKDSNGASKGVGFVNYENPEDAEKAFEEMNGSQLGSKPLYVARVQKRNKMQKYKGSNLYAKNIDDGVTDDPNGRKSGVRNLFVKNLDEKIDSMKLKDLFSSFGTIISCKVVASSDGKSKGFGFVQYDSEDSVKSAIENLNGKKVEDKEIYVAHFIKKSDRVLFSSDAKFTNLKIKNFDFDVTEEQLMEKFSKFGSISNLVILKDSNGASKGVGFVNYENPEDAEKAFEEMNGSQLGSKTLYVARPQKNAKGSILYVKNIDDGVTDDELRDQFSQFGTIISVKLMCDDKGIKRGFGFVCLSSPDEANKAVNGLNGFILHGKPLYVSLAQNKEDRRSHLSSS